MAICETQFAPSLTGIALAGPRKIKIIQPNGPGACPGAGSSPSRHGADRRWASCTTGGGARCALCSRSRLLQMHSAQQTHWQV